MTAYEDFASVPPFSLNAPAQQRVPFIFNSPHSGRHYPDRFLAMSRLDRHSVRKSEDCYVEELFGGVVALGAPLLEARFPRAYLDVNREPWELDPRMFVESLPGFANIRSARVAGGLGTIPKVVGEGQDIYPAKLHLAEALTRIDALYKPYHQTLKDLVSGTLDRFGCAVLIDCHSMPASIRLGEASVRPDFIIGDRFGAAASSALTEHAISVMVGMGYEVAHNKPYAGGFITEHYGRPAIGVHALQIEVNRGLYMNERTYQKSAGFDALTQDLTRMAAELMSLPEHYLMPLPIAAE